MKNMRFLGPTNDMKFQENTNIKAYEVLGPSNKMRLKILSQIFCVLMDNTH